MRYKTINNALFINNRLHFKAHLLASSIAVFNSNDIMPTNADGIMGFRQNNDLFYLSGIDQEDTILLIYPESLTQKYREILFIKETNEHISIWEGNKLSKKDAADISGISTVYWLHQFRTIFNSLAVEVQHIYLNTNEHTRADKKMDSKDDRFIKKCKEMYPLHRYERSAPIMQALRMLKSPIEIELMKQACTITEKGFRKILPMVKPGVMEFEIEAELTHEFIRNRSSGHAYSPIIASGADSCILHYVKNDKAIGDGEIVLLDVGASYANYSADMTRCLPSNGKFNERQKSVYNAVLKIMRKSIPMLVAGNTFDNYIREVNKLVESELIGLGLLSSSDVKKQDPENPAFKKYFMHGISHFLGLDVHDVGDRNVPFKAGMVFTCEPGIYIREEKLGIRLENNIVITKEGNMDLMKDIPIEPDEIEALMNS
jgi:Xaa-Pro aminopeptidase